MFADVNPIKQLSMRTKRLITILSLFVVVIMFASCESIDLDNQLSDEPEILLAKGQPDLDLGLIPIPKENGYIIAYNNLNEYNVLRPIWLTKCEICERPFPMCTCKSQCLMCGNHYSTCKCSNNGGELQKPEGPPVNTENQFAPITLNLTQNIYINDNEMIYEPLDLGIQNCPDGRGMMYSACFRGCSLSLLEQEYRSVFRDFGADYSISNADKSCELLYAVRNGKIYFDYPCPCDSSFFTSDETSTSMDLALEIYVWNGPWNNGSAWVNVNLEHRVFLKIFIEKII